MVNGNCETRIIDTDILSAEKIERQRFLAEKALEEEKNTYEDEFREGINVENIEELMEDKTEEQVIVVNEPKYTGPTPEELVNEANAKVASMLQEAKEEASRMVDEAELAGYQEGYDKGTKAAVKELEDKKAVLEEQMSCMRQNMEEQTTNLEKEMAEVFTDIYEHVLGISLENLSPLIFHLVNEAIHKADNEKNFIIHISETELGFIKENKEKLLEGLASNISIEIIEDVSLHQGEAYIETNGGIFDCGVEVTLKNLRKEISMLSYEKKNAPFG